MDDLVAAACRKANVETIRAPSPHPHLTFHQVRIALRYRDRYYLRSARLLNQTTSLTISRKIIASMLFRGTRRYHSSRSSSERKEKEKDDIGERTREASNNQPLDDDICVSAYVIRSIFPSEGKKRRQWKNGGDVHTFMSSTRWRLKRSFWLILSRVYLGEVMFVDFNIRFPFVMLRDR